MSSVGKGKDLRGRERIRLDSISGSELTQAHHYEIMAAQRGLDTPESLTRRLSWDRKGKEKCNSGGE
jgi:hypothetical protein